jgi:pimeloyl-ACP methyl ester carboxylesterase
MCAQKSFLLLHTRRMLRRNFLQMSSVSMIALAAGAVLGKAAPLTIDSAWYRHKRRFVDLPMARVAYVEFGRGPAALFIHGYPLSNYQWRGALERLHPYRRCIAPDMMSLGYTEVPAGQPITPHTQVEMLAALLEKLKIRDVDLVGNDSGGFVSQLFLAKYPQRVRSLLLTNCDVDENNPPAGVLPLIALAKQGLFVEKAIVPQLADKTLARSSGRIGGAFSYPERLQDETIEMYFRPIAASPLKMSQVDEYLVALGTNELVAIRKDLQTWQGAARMVWGLKDQVFGVEWAEWLDRMLPNSRGIRRVEDAKVFFPEEMPDIIAEEAKQLWKV